MKADNNLIRSIEIKNRVGQPVGFKEVVTYQGLLSKAHEEGLAHVKTSLVQIPSEDNGQVAIVKAEVETGNGVYEGLGDASPESVNSFIVPHLIRMAETRAKARALRDAVNVGVVSFEELDGMESEPGSIDPGSGSETAQNEVSSPTGLRPLPSRIGRLAGAPDLMSEAQRRYLFRLVAGQGLQGEAAEQYLHELFEVDSLTKVTKSEATALIDRLLNSPPEEIAAGGATQRQ
jgi:hypothetical protein